MDFFRFVAGAGAAATKIRRPGAGAVGMPTAPTQHCQQNRCARPSSHKYWEARVFYKQNFNTFSIRINFLNLTSPVEDILEFKKILFLVLEKKVQAPNPPKNCNKTKKIPETLQAMSTEQNYLCKLVFKSWLFKTTRIGDSGCRFTLYKELKEREKNSECHFYIWNLSWPKTDRLRITALCTSVVSNNFQPC